MVVQSNYYDLREKNFKFLDNHTSVRAHPVPLGCDAD
jgi:hypothetical protein